MYTNVSGGLPAGQYRGIPTSPGGGSRINIIQLRKQSESTITIIIIAITKV